MENVIQTKETPAENISKSRLKLIVKNTLLLTLGFIVVFFVGAIAYGTLFPNSEFGGLVIAVVIAILAERVVTVSLVTTIVATIWLTRKIKTVAELKTAGRKSMIISTVLTIFISGILVGSRVVTGNNDQENNEADFRASVEMASTVTNIRDCEKKEIVLAWDVCIQPLVIDKGSYDVCKAFSKKIGTGDVDERVVYTSCEMALMNNIHDAAACKEIVGPDLSLNCVEGRPLR